MILQKQSLLVHDARTARRNAAERRFRTYGLCAIGIAALALLVLPTTVVSNGVSSFRQSYITLEIARLQPSWTNPARAIVRSWLRLRRSGTRHCCETRC
jgi:cobalamin biosynthesis protein CbiD